MSSLQLIPISGDPLNSQILWNLISAPNQATGSSSSLSTVAGSSSLCAANSLGPFNLVQASTQTCSPAAPLFTLSGSNLQLVNHSSPVVPSPSPSAAPPSAQRPKDVSIPPTASPVAVPIRDGLLPTPNLRENRSWTVVTKRNRFPSRSKKANTSSPFDTKGPLPPSSGACFRCLKPGHFVRSCRADIVCWRCSKSGHMGKDCPSFHTEPVGRRPSHSAAPLPRAGLSTPALLRPLYASVNPPRCPPEILPCLSAYTPSSPRRSSGSHLCN